MLRLKNFWIFGFSNYEYYSFGTKGEVIKEISIDKGVDVSIKAILKEDSGCVLPKWSLQNVEQIITLPDNIDAPIQENQEIGEIKYILNGDVLGTIPIVSNKSVKKLSLSNINEKLLFSWFNLLR